MRTAIQQSNGIHDSLGNAEPSTPKQLLAEVADICRRVNSAIARQSSDRTRGRFFGPDVVGAARIEEVDADYMSDEDTVAVLFEYDGGRQGFEVGMAERLMRTRQAGASQAIENVQQLSIHDPCGLVRMRWFEPVMQQREQVMHDDERAFRLLLQPKEGLNYKISCSQIIHGVCMKWHEEREFYTLSRDDQRALDAWLSARQTSSQSHTLQRRSRATKRMQKAQRKGAKGRSNG